jgi:hypothetical protein
MRTLLGYRNQETRMVATALPATGRKALSTTGLLVAAMGLAACQITTQLTPAFAAEAERACADYGRVPGTELYANCVNSVADQLAMSARHFRFEQGASPEYCIATIANAPPEIVATHPQASMMVTTDCRGN